MPNVVHQYEEMNHYQLAIIGGKPIPILLEELDIEYDGGILYSATGDPVETKTQRLISITFRMIGNQLGDLPPSGENAFIVLDDQMIQVRNYHIVQQSIDRETLDRPSYIIDIDATDFTQSER